MSLLRKAVQRVDEQEQDFLNRFFASSKGEKGSMLNDPPEKAWQAKSRYEIDKNAESQDKDRKFKYIVLVVLSAWLVPLYADYYWWEELLQLARKLLFC